MGVSLPVMGVPGVLGGGGSTPPLASDAFPADVNPLADIWTNQIGTFEANTGIARAKTIALDGNNLVANGEFTTNTDGWTLQQGAVLTRRDYTAAPDIDPTGGADEYGMEVAHSATALGYAIQSLNFVTGITYTLSARAYAPSSNTEVRASRPYMTAGGATSAPGTVEDAWETLSCSLAATAASGSVRLYCYGSTSGDLVHYDKVSLQQTGSIVTCDPGQADVAIAVDVTLPASGVVPFGLVVRFQDANHYWLVRIRPGTAGVDFELVSVNGSTITVVASSDQDWGAGQTYALDIVCHGTDIAVSVADVLTLSYVSAYLQTETLCGLYDAGVANGKFDNWIVTANHDPGLYGLIVSGDSISDGAGEWPALVAADRHYVLFNHSVSGQNVVDNMLAQVSASASEWGDIAICQLSTNDTDLDNFQAAYQAALAQLKSDHAGITIYCMGTLDRTNMSGVPEKRVLVAAAAAAEGATYWDTSGWIDPATDTDDGLHPNATGSAKIAAQVAARL